MAVFYASRLLLTQRTVAPPNPASSQQPAPGLVPSGSNPLGPTAPEPAAPKQELETSQPEAPLVADKVEDVVVETALYSATLSNHGAVLRSFKLKLYTDDTNKPIELIDPKSAEKVGWPLAISTSDAKLDEVISNANFVVKRENTRVAMEFASSEVSVQKSFGFDPLNYQLSIESNVSRSGKSVAHSILWQSAFGDQSIPYNPAKAYVVRPNSASFKTTAVASLKDPEELTVNRIGVRDQYFLAMFLLPANATVRTRKLEFPGDDGKPVPTGSVLIPSVDQPTRLYLGPMDPKTLSRVDPQLEAVIDYGFFGVIAKPLTYALLWIHSFIGNFGWAIILLTLFINFVLFPLRIKQQVSMQKMQKIQPQMRTLQDKYKKLKPTDPKRVEIQTQMMNVYKEHGINPMSGCLPLLLQMPFLYAFYTMLSVAIELRHAPWMLWIHDLSKADPYHIMPLTMAASMIIQQKMTPTAVDPAQARMMMIMPVMLAVLLWSSQSGLMLYWLTSNVVGISQQFFLNKYWGAGTETSASKKANKKTDRDG